MKFECEDCHSYFSTKSNLNQHCKKYCKKGKITITKFQCSHCKKYFSAKSSLTRHLVNLCEKKMFFKPKLKPNFKQKKHKTSKISEIITTKPKLNVVSDCIFLNLSKEINEEDAINFLLLNFLNKNYGKIIERAYLTDIHSDEYPMVCSGSNHFRFLDGNGSLIDDPNGELLVTRVSYNIINAILRVSNSLITKYVIDNTSKLYNTYDLRKIQGDLCIMSQKKTKNMIKKFLAKRVLNPNHPFFNQNNKTVNHIMI